MKTTGEKKSNRGKGEILGASTEYERIVERGEEVVSHRSAQTLFYSWTLSLVQRK